MLPVVGDDPVAVLWGHGRTEPSVPPDFTWPESEKIAAAQVLVAAADKSGKPTDILRGLPAVTHNGVAVPRSVAAGTGAWAYAQLVSPEVQRGSTAARVDARERLWTQDDA